jgi:hypothetical protein
MSIKTPSKELLLEMVKKEEEIRWSPWYQSECDIVKDEVNGWLRISEQVQYQVVKEFGFENPIEADIAVNQLRRARYIYPDEPLFQTIPVYVRNNRAKQCVFKERSIVPNILIGTMDGNDINLYQILNQTQPNVLIGSSHT